MDQAQLLSLIGSLYDKFVADVSAKVEVRIQQVIKDTVQTKIDELSDMDKSMILEIVRGEIEDLDVEEKISDWMDHNFDINTYIKDQLDISEEVSDYLSDHLSDRVKDEVRDLSFSVTVD